MITNIDDHVFESCSSLKELYLPKYTLTIEHNIVINSYKLTSIIIPPLVTSINENAFKDSGVTKLFYCGTNQIDTNLGIISVVTSRDYPYSTIFGITPTKSLTNCPAPYPPLKPQTPINKNCINTFKLVHLKKHIFTHIFVFVTKIH